MGNMVWVHNSALTEVLKQLRTKSSHHAVLSLASGKSGCGQHLHCDSGRVDVASCCRKSCNGKTPKAISRYEIESTDTRTRARGGKDCDMAREMLFHIEPSCDDGWGLDWTTKGSVRRWHGGRRPTRRRHRQVWPPGLSIAPSADWRAGRTSFPPRHKQGGLRRRSLCAQQSDEDHRQPSRARSAQHCFP